MTHQPTPLDLTQIDAVLFDMDGVIYRGEQPLPSVNELLAFLKRREIEYACITNNAGRTPAQFEAKLKRLDIDVPAAHIVTSSVATNLWLREREPRGTKVLAVGMEGLTEQLFGDGYFTLETVQPQYVVVGIDFELTYAKLQAACLAIRAGATFIGTNPDLTFPSEAGLIPGCGALLAAVEAATSQKPMIIGKPAPAMFTAALKLVGAAPERTLMVGDRYDTDIVGGAKAGLKTAMVLTGVSDRAEAEHGEVPPGAIFTDLTDLLQHWQAALP